MTRVLIVKTSSMGDVLHTLPALTDAANIIKDITFDWVVEEGFAQIPTWHKTVNVVMPVAIRRWRKSWFSQSAKQEREQFYQALQQHNYDAVIDAQGLLKSAVLITRKAKGLKHGQNWQSAREPLASLFYNKRHNIPKNQHAVERTRQLFAASLGYNTPQSLGDYAIASHFLSNSAQSTEPYLVFLHATTRDNKHWPETHWRELLRFAGEKGLKVKLPWGTAAEQQRALRLAENMQHAEVLSKLSLSEIAHILAGAQGVVSVDTGLSHLTAALSRPNISLYGPTDPSLIGGYGKNQHSLISASQQMKDIKPDEVFNTLQKIIINN